MAFVQLAPTERKSLRNVLDTTHDVREFRRAQPLLWLDDGMPVQQAVEHQHVIRQAIYGWILRFKSHPKMTASERLADAPRSG